MGNVLISIVTVTYNASSVLEVTLKSIKEQTFSNFEHIIIDGKSTDQTVSMLENSDLEFATFISEPDQGIYDAMNKSRKHIQGGWVIFMNAGDSFNSKNTLSELALILKETQADVVVGKTNTIYETGFSRIAEPLAIEQSWKRLVGCHQSMLVRSKLFIKAGFDLQYKYSADYDFFFKLYQDGIKFTFSTAIIAKYAMGGVSDRQRLDAIREKYKICFKHSTSQPIQRRIYFAYELITAAFKQFLKKYLLPKKSYNMIYSLKYKDGKYGKKNKIVLYAPSHCWDDIRVYYKYACSFASKGLEVELYANESKSILTPTKGVRVHHLSPKTNPVSRFISDLKSLISEKAPIYHLHNPKTLPMVFALKLYGKKVIYDTHEDFSQRFKLRSKYSPVFRLILGFLVSSLEKLASKCSDLTVVTQDKQKDVFSGTVALLGNYPVVDPQLMKEISKYKKEISTTENEFRLVYIGTMNAFRGLITMLDVLEQLNKNDTVRLWLITKVDDVLLREAQEHNAWKFVDYLGWLKLEKAYAYAASADIGLILIDDIGDHKLTSPNKLFEYILVGTKFVASNFAYWKKLIGNNRALGDFVDTQNTEKITDIILTIKNQNIPKSECMKNSTKYLQKYSWQNDFDRFYNHCILPLLLSKKSIPKIDARR